MRSRLFFCATLLAIVGCGDDDTTPPDYAADPISDLSVTVMTPHSVRLDWTAPVVEGAWAGGYEIRYREGSFPADAWDGATAMEDPPLPSEPDEAQFCQVYGVPASATLVFRIRHNLDGWYSDLSNPGAVEMPDAPPIPDGFVYVPSGSYTLGSPTDERGRDDDEDQHLVTLTQALFLGEYEVTQAEYEALTGADPSTYDGADQPVEGVDWYDAVAYCNARSLAEGLTCAYAITGTDVVWNRDADGYRLPTEAEWEFACRAGTVESFCSGNLTEFGCGGDVALSLVGVYCNTDVDADDTTDGDEDGPDGPADVGGLQPNFWGLRDMHGNVYEWCWDWYAVGVSYPTTDPAGPDQGLVRVMRGGCWTSPVEACRSAARSYADPSRSNSGVGFRVARLAE